MPHFLASRPLVHYPRSCACLSTLSPSRVRQPTVVDAYAVFIDPFQGMETILRTPERHRLAQRMEVVKPSKMLTFMCAGGMQRFDLIQSTVSSMS
jgi:hypothetical protein